MRYGDAEDSAVEWVRSWSETMSERAAAAQQLSDEVSRLTVSELDDDRAIRVTVNGSGAMTDLHLAPEAGRLPVDQLAATIMRTMRRAQADLAVRVGEIAARTVGSDSETARQVVFSFERRFPASPDESPTSDGSVRGR